MSIQYYTRSLVQNFVKEPNLSSLLARGQYFLDTLFLVYLVTFYLKVKFIVFSAETLELTRLRAFEQYSKVLIPTRRPLRRLSVLTSPTVATSMATSSINGSPRQIADEQTLFTRLSSSFASSRRTSSQMSTRPSSSELFEVKFDFVQSEIQTWDWWLLIVQSSRL